MLADVYLFLQFFYTVSPFTPRYFPFHLYTQFTPLLLELNNPLGSRRLSPPCDNYVRLSRIPLVFLYMSILIRFAGNLAVLSLIFSDIFLTFRCGRPLIFTTIFNFLLLLLKLPQEFSLRFIKSFCLFFLSVLQNRHVTVLRLRWHVLFVAHFFVQPSLPLLFLHYPPCPSHYIFLLYSLLLRIINSSDNSTFCTMPSGVVESLGCSASLPCCRRSGYLAHVVGLLLPLCFRFTYYPYVVRKS